jgi:hypothetical protein
MRIRKQDDKIQDDKKRFRSQDSVRKEKLSHVPSGIIERIPAIYGWVNENQKNYRPSGTVGIYPG